MTAYGFTTSYTAAEGWATGHVTADQLDHCCGEDIDWSDPDPWRPALADVDGRDDLPVVPRWDA